MSVLECTTLHRPSNKQGLRGNLIRSNTSDLGIVPPLVYNILSNNSPGSGGNLFSGCGGGSDHNQNIYIFKPTQHIEITHPNNVNLKLAFHKVASFHPHYLTLITTKCTGSGHGLRRRHHIHTHTSTSAAKKYIQPYLSG